MSYFVCIPGYLREQVCHDAAELFLRDSTHLAEYRSLLDQGYTALLTIGGRTLLDTLSLCQLEPGNIASFAQYYHYLHESH